MIHCTSHHCFCIWRIEVVDVLVAEIVSVRCNLALCRFTVSLSQCVLGLYVTPPKNLSINSFIFEILLL